MTGVEKKMEEHLEGFPARQKEMVERFDRLEKKFDLAASHPKASAQTIAMYGELKDEISEWTKINDERHKENVQKLERITRVLFGDQYDKNDNGMQGMVKDIHSKIAGEMGFWDRVFFLAKVSGAVSAIAFLIVGIIAFSKKF